MGCGGVQAVGLLVLFHEHCSGHAEFEREIEVEDMTETKWLHSCRRPAARGLTLTELLCQLWRKNDVS